MASMIGVPQSAVIPAHEYITSGNYISTLRVTDNLGLANKVRLKSRRYPPGELIDVGGQTPQNQTWPTGYWFRAIDNVIIPAGVTLTIEPGVEVRFNNHNGLLVYGTLVVRGTASAPVVFTIQ